jgi:hypothetical protein
MPDFKSYANVKVCASLPVLNEKCGSNFECRSGLGCSDAGICEALATSGKACQMSETGPHICASGLLCYNSICEATKMELNSPCSDFSKECASNLGCSFSNVDGTSKFVSRRLLNEECTSKECSTGLYCNFENNKCDQLLV